MPPLLTRTIAALAVLVSIILSIELKKLKLIIMDKYICEVCGYEYDPEIGDPDNGIAAGTPFEELPEDWKCPLCAVGKELFAKA